MFLFFIKGLARNLLSSLSKQRSVRESALPNGDDEVRENLAERSAEMSRLRDQLAEQHRELESIREELKEKEGLGTSLQLANQELVKYHLFTFN